MRLDPENFTSAFAARFEEAGFRMAERKIAELDRLRAVSPPPRVRLRRRLATGGRFTGIFLWDTAFCTRWAQYRPDRFPLFDSLDNLYRLRSPEGFISREYQADGKVYWSSEHPVAFAPPLLAWAELELFRAGVSDLARLRRVFPALRRHHGFCRAHYRRDADGLYFGDALGCGMDDLPRMPLAPRPELAHAGIDFEPRFILADDKKMWKYIEGKPLYSWNRQMGWIDMSSQMALDAECLAEIAAALGHPRLASSFRAEHADLARRINELCWDEARGFYFDRCGGGVIPRYHAGAFWTMIAGVVPPERAGRVVETLCDPAVFDRLVPLAALGADDPGFDPEAGYWRGAVWPPTTYIALLGLRRIGAESVAVDFARRTYNAYAELFRTTGGFWENISCEQFDRPKERSNGEHCGWSLLVPVNIAREFPAIF